MIYTDSGVEEVFVYKYWKVVLVVGCGEQYAKTNTSILYYSIVTMELLSMRNRENNIGVSSLCSTELARAGASQSSSSS